MRKILFLSFLPAIMFFLSSCGVGSSNDEVSVSGEISTDTPQITSASIKVGDTEIGYISALSAEDHKKTKFTVAKIRDNGKFYLKLKKKRKYSFVLYDKDGNPVTGIKKGSKNAFKFLDDATLNIQLGDNNNDGKPDVISISTDQNVEEVEDENMKDENYNNIPDNAEDKNVKNYEDKDKDKKHEDEDDDEDKNYDSDNDHDNTGDVDNNNDSNDNNNDNDTGNNDNNNNNDNDNNGNTGGNNDGNTGGGNTGGGNTGGNTGNLFTTGNGYTILAWNDLGMHCMDGNDYSVFSILPPYNTLHAHVIKQGKEPDIMKNLNVTYEAVADPDTGSINTISSTKTNFWQYVQKLFNASVAPDVGLTGKPMQSTTPAPMDYNSTYKIFQAEGIPITPYDDNTMTNTIYLHTSLIYRQKDTTISHLYIRQLKVELLYSVQHVTDQMLYQEQV